MINADAALKSTHYKAYLNAASELERVTLHDLTVRERIAFFLNVYQCMYIHYFLKVTNEERVNNEANAAATTSYTSLIEKLQ